MAVAIMGVIFALVIGAHLYFWLDCRGFLSTHLLDNVHFTRSPRRRGRAATAGPCRSTGSETNRTATMTRNFNPPD